MVKTPKSLLQNQVSFRAESWYTAFRAQRERVTFLGQGIICVPMYLYEENVEKLFFQNKLKT